VTIVKWIVRLASLAIALLFLVPIIWMLVVSVKREGMKIATAFDWFTPPYSFSVYREVIVQTKLTNWVWNSFFVAVCVMVLTVGIAAMAGYAMSKLRFRYKTFMYFFILAGFLIPGEAILVPLYQVAKNLDILNSYGGLILPVLASPLAIIVLKGFFDGVPNDLIESVQIDGGGTWRVFAGILLPLTRPALASIAIITFIASWNNFLWPFLSVTDDRLFTLPMGIPTLMSQYAKDYVKPMAINTVASIPIIALFLVFERQIVKGISLTGMK